MLSWKGMITRRSSWVGPVPAHIIRDNGKQRLRCELYRSKNFQLGGKSSPTNCSCSRCPEKHMMLAPRCEMCSLLLPLAKGSTDQPAEWILWDCISGAPGSGGGDGGAGDTSGRRVRGCAVGQEDFEEFLGSANISVRSSKENIHSICRRERKW